VDTDAWLVVAGLVSLAGASLAVRGLGQLVSRPIELGAYLLALIVAAYLGWRIAEDMELGTGPLGAAVGLAMVEAGPWVFALVKGLVRARVGQAGSSHAHGKRQDKRPDDKP